MSDAHIAGLIAQLPADKQHNTPWLRAILNQKQGFKQPSRIERMQVAVDQREAERVKQALANARVDSFNGAESYEAWRRSPKQPGAVLVGPPVGAKASAQNHPFGRNRYSNIFPYDHARVMLTGAPHDYINASLLDTGALANTPAAERYIAAQGPLKNTAADFWLMAWEQNSRVIVMLTGCTEGGRDKCFNYWPSKGEPAWSFEFTGVISFNIECIDEVKAAPGLDVRSFKVVATSTTSTDSENASTVERIIRQVHFTSWPDHQSSDPSSILTVIDVANKYQDEAALSSFPTSKQDGSILPLHTPPGPMIVHCSAGVGRTGTFVVIDSVLKRIKKSGLDMKFEAMDTASDSFDIDPVYQCVMTIRSQRVMMVQTMEQFKICYEAILLRLLEWNK